MDFHTGIPEIDNIHSIADMMAYVDASIRRDKVKQQQPIRCKDCGNLWMECTCDETNITHNIFAFRSFGGDAIKVWTCEDTVFIEQETDDATKSMIFAEPELTEIAERWLRHVKKSDV